MEEEKMDLPQPDEEPEDLEVPEGDPEAITGGSKIIQASHDMKKDIISNFRV
jgi:hypothetical protein